MCFLWLFGVYIVWGALGDWNSGMGLFLIHSLFGLTLKKHLIQH